MNNNDMVKQIDMISEFMEKRFPYMKIIGYRFKDDEEKKIRNYEFIVAYEDAVW